MSEICYLCGRPIENDRSVDHLPPKQFYAPSLRSVLNLSQLLTLPAHGVCNRSFERDEEYFTWSLGSLALGSTAGIALAGDRAAKLKAGRAQGLFHAVLREFESRPSGLHLPADLVVKRVQGDRIARVAWKLVRGLYFYETSFVLPEDTPFTSELIEPKRAGEAAGQNALWEAVKSQLARGSYGGVFEYKYFVGEVDGKKLHAWGMLLWDQLMLFLAHHHPQISGVNGNAV